MFLQAQLEQLNQAFEQEKNLREVIPGWEILALMSNAMYAQQREKLESQIAALDAKIEQERDVMADMFKEQKLMKLSTGNGQSVGKKKMN